MKHFRITLVLLVAFVVWKITTHRPAEDPNTATIEPRRSEVEVQTDASSKDPAVSDTSARVEFVFLDEVDEAIRAAVQALTDGDIAEAFQHYERSRLTLHPYRSVMLPADAGQRQAALKERLADLRAKLRDAFESNREMILSLWRRGDLVYADIMDLYAGVEVGRDGVPVAMKEASREAREAARVARLRGICVYIHAPNNPLLEQAVDQAVRQLARIEGRSVFIWSNVSGERISGSPWLNVRLLVRELQSPYGIGHGEFTYNISLPTGYNVAMEVTSAAKMATSWDSVTQLRLDVELPTEMTFSSQDDWFPQYVQARARHLASESMMTELVAKLGALVIHPEVGEQLSNPEAPITMSLLRARSAHAPGMFREDVAKTLRLSHAPDAVLAVATVLAETPHATLEMSRLVHALQSLSQEQLDALAVEVSMLRDIANPAVLLAIASQVEGHARMRLISSLRFSRPEVRKAAMPFADGELPSVPAARQSIAGYLVNFAPQEEGVRAAFYREKLIWLMDPDPEFAATVANRMLSNEPDVAGELIFQAIGTDKRSAAFLAKLGSYSRTPRGLAITRKGYGLIPIADPDVQKRLATRLSINAGESAEDWHKLFKVAKHPKVTPENRKRIYSNLRRKSSVVDDKARAALQEAMK